MKALTFITVLILLVYSCSTRETIPAGNSGLETKVDSLVKTFTDSGKVAGMAVAVFRGDQKILLKSYGYADLEWDVRLPVDGSFEIGSVTKQFTAAAIMQLAEAGKLNLDDDLTKYLRFDTGGKKVSIRHLLSHTSGIKGYTELSEFGDISRQKLKRDTLLSILGKKEFDFLPGDALIYNNSGFFMLGLIIEKVSGTTYEEYVSNNLFDKAGMTHAYYASESRIVKNRVHGYDKGEKGLVRAGYLDHTWPYAAGSLACSAEDLVKWNNALHKGKILGKEFYREFITPATLNDGTVTRYAKGIDVIQDHGRALLSHGGAINGFLADLRYYPSEEISIAVLINTLGEVSPDNLSKFISDQLFGKSTDLFVPFTGDVSRYLGVYKGRGRGIELVVEVMKNDSSLAIRTNGRKMVPIFHVQGQTWRNKGNNLYQFVERKDAVNELRIDQVSGYYLLKKDPNASLPLSGEGAGKK